jgi:hypothetical protein
LTGLSERCCAFALPLKRKFDNFAFGAMLWRPLRDGASGRGPRCAGPPSTRGLQACPRSLREFAAGGAYSDPMPGREELPLFVSPMLARTRPLPAEQGWAIEVKFDGMRLQLRRDENAVCLRSLPGRDCSEEFPELAAIAGVLGRHRVLLDGELVCWGADQPPLRKPPGTAIRPGRQGATARRACAGHLSRVRPAPPRRPLDARASLRTSSRAAARPGARRAGLADAASLHRRDRRGCRPRPASTAWRGSSPRGWAAHTCPARETGPGSSTSTGAPSSFL